MKRELVFPNLSKKLAQSAWKKKSTKNIRLNPALYRAFVEILDREMSKPNLGCATTGQMLNEIKARVDCNYSTVFYEKPLPPTTT